ncbi:hypothetical protein AJ85_06275 [Alkalihalobacillus alcalophilus ATCC 27647 = CGMCC 1.3604]|uniref:Uncharacterized protein n=1 Tax=Alkalihalobacillus alcalophilus ATCC 27647 = CGMCC 1.3604 TaxID=1218173 RepID=A0A094WQ93_ALKAL|nr:hypothetical protein [Alkalihalobacillus alcalophilus]KGA98193.1 hypothetical protein BALCAV_0206020 [Alkalihalobacillus alcalophilus ATCC 27647 = CGMCC 1.3604]MED1560811.1 hypothetical protein [Alkalihalobacillus alcalophilus]THG91199.1 hypothetical protein AJ85_06275 [Alkalihalobacillus alcalophilus ATCC 27647 = CGMCC 1.3604]
MNRKKQITVISFLLVLILGIGSYTIYSNTKRVEDNLNLSFANNYISYVINEEDKTMKFNLFGLLDTSSTNDEILQKINSLSLNNSEMIIMDFEVDSGIIYKGHQIVNFIIEIEFKSLDTLSADTLFINYSDNKEEAFEIGEITLANSSQFQTEDSIDITEAHTIGYPSPSLEITLDNQGDNEIKIINVYDLNKTINSSINEFYIKSNDSNQLIVDEFDNTGEDIDFYTVTPIIEYRSGDINNEYVLPGMIYGVLLSDEEKIDMMLN